MSYFPLHYITTNQYTSGGEFMYKSSQIEYTGYYWKTGNGKFYSGQTPQSPNIVEIVPIIPINFGTFEETPKYTEKIRLANIGDGPLDYFTVVADLPIEENIISSYANLKKIPQNNLTTKYLPQYNPSPPTSQDYQNGEFIRYFAKKTNELQYIEINQQTYDLLRQKNPTIEWTLYLPLTLSWQLTGDIKQVQQVNRNITGAKIQSLKLYKFDEYLKFDFLKYYQPEVGTMNSGSYINGVNQGYVLDNRDGRSTGVLNSQNDSGSVRRDNSTTR
jgi:hypothetical protein